jgi:hypothetical protein
VKPKKTTTTLPLKSAERARLAVVVGQRKLAPYSAPVMSMP